MQIVGTQQCQLHDQSGRFLASMLIFSVQHFQSTWKPTTSASSENCPWIYGNKEEWMDSPTSR